MTPTDQRAPAPSLTARINERILAPPHRNPGAARWFVATLASILFLHAAILAFFLDRGRPAPELVAQKEQTPVEVVIEQPKDEPRDPEKKPEPPKPQPKQAIERPASSAPRVPNVEKVDTASPRKETRAPKSETPPTDGKPETAKDASSPSPDATGPNKAEEAAAKPDVFQKDAEALDKASEKPKERPKKLAKLTPRAKTRRVATALQQLADASSLPDYSFARPTKKSPVYGGTEDSRYLAIVYGMIMRHRSQVAIPGNVGGHVTITFSVDDDGNVIGIGVQRTSGYPQIDAEAAAAIRRASPLPPPPAGAPHGLVATIDFGDMESADTTGSQGR